MAESATTTRSLRWPEVRVGQRVMVEGLRTGRGWATVARIEHTSDIRGDWLYLTDLDATLDETLGAIRHERVSGAHDCDEHAVPYDHRGEPGAGPLGHGFECGRCGRFLQAG